MGKMQRDKGAAGERELFRLLSDDLGYIVKRRLGAAREGGCDGLDVPGWAIEVKRTEQLLGAHWIQAQDQASVLGLKPVLFWRPSRRPWSAFVHPHDVFPEVFSNTPDGLMVLPVSRWCELVRSMV